MNYLSELQIQKLLKLSDEYERALYLVSILFANKKDKAGLPYINHLIRVSINVNEKNTKVAALLHDTVEDIENFTFDDLKALDFNEEVISLIKWVTKDKYDKEYTQEEKKEIYHNKITSIIESGNIEAVRLKYADMSDNFDEERLSRLDIDTQNKLKNKYANEIIRLEKYLKERNIL